MRSLVVSAIYEQLLYRNMQWFRGGLAFKAHRLLYHGTLGVRVIKKKIPRGPIFFFITLKPRIEWYNNL